MAVALESFEDLLQAAREQPLRQRFLLVFAKAVLPGGAKPEQAERFRARQGGALVPVMYADKGEYELTCFQDLLDEARHTIDALGNGVDTNWDLVIVGCLDGHAADEPLQQEVDAAFRDLLQSLRMGKSLGNLVAFDREGRPVRFE